MKNITIFARVTPEDKYRVLSAIKTTEICAMTGDGVNDVPALVGAHVGIAMGDSPSIVQDAGDIVLLDNNFKTFPKPSKKAAPFLPISAACSAIFSPRTPAKLSRCLAL